MPGTKSTRASRTIPRPRRSARTALRAEGRGFRMYVTCYGPDRCVVAVGLYTKFLWGIVVGLAGCGCDRNGKGYQSRGTWV